MPDAAPAPPLTLYESLLLLAIDAKTGVLVRGVWRPTFDKALVAAALSELALHGRLRPPPPEPSAGRPGNPLRAWLERGNGPVPTAGELVLDDATPTGRAYADHVLAVVATHPAAMMGRPHTLSAWALMYAGPLVRWGERMGTLEEMRLAAADLVARGTLTALPPPEYQRHLRPPRYPAAAAVDTGADALRAHLTARLAADAPSPDDRTLALLALVRAAGLSGAVFGKPNGRRADRRIGRLLRRREAASWLTRGIDRLVIGEMWNAEIASVRR